MTYSDLVPVLAIGRAGSLAGAARDLNVDHSTIFRRLAAIEQRLGVRLFDRSRTGYKPTSAGQAMLELAARFEADIVELELGLVGQDARPAGPLRVTTTDTLIDLLVPICVTFSKRFGDIAIELLTGNEFLDLSRRDADVAVRPTAKPPEHLHGRRMGRMTFSVFGSDPAMEILGLADLAHQQWVGFDESLSHILAYKWMQAHVPRQNIALKASSMLAVGRAVAQGAGMAVLPCHYGDEHPGLHRIFGPIPEVATDFWLLVHEDIRRVARVRMFTDFAYAEFQRLRPLIERL
jgi:DNA-binding transcriptional LysR family regulator